MKDIEIIEKLDLILQHLNIRKISPVKQAGPIPTELHDAIFESRVDNYWADYPIDFNDPVISIAGLKSYISMGIGLRVYAAAALSGGVIKVSPLITLTSGENLVDDSDYYLLDGPSYTRPTDGTKYNETGANGLVSYYKNNVKVGISPGMPQNSSSRRSRFFYKDEVIHQLLQGIPPANYDNYQLKLEIGYLDETRSAMLPAMFPSQIPNPLPAGYTANNFHVGFTCLFTIYDSDDRFYRCVEIGKPCPPYCGSLNP